MRDRLARRLLIVGIVILAMPTLSITQPPYPAVTFDEDKAYRILRVIDGDTIEVEYEGKDEKVRLIGVDTPETVHPNKPVEPYGRQASAFTKNLLLGESVYLKYGEERRGKYDRLLAYVYRAPDGLFVNLELVRQGYGRAYTKYPFEHMKAFVEYEKIAQSANKGLWGEPEPETPDVKSEETVYITKSGKKYHLESCRWGNISMPLAEAKKHYEPCSRCVLSKR